MKNNLAPKNENGDSWLKNSLGEIISAENINSYIAELDLDSAKDKLSEIFDWDELVKNGDKTWSDYFDTLEDGAEEYIPDLIKNTDDLSKLTGDDLVQANQNARQSALAHNAALKQQTLGAKAAKFAMQALATVGNMVVSTLIAKGISKLINIETEALENAQKAYEKSIEEVDKIQEKEELIFSSTKELSELLASEDWGAESAKRAGEIYEEMANKLEETNGAENDRIQQLRDEAKQIRENINLSEEERKKKLEENRQSALIDSGWGKQTS